jgi:NlpC/P60 family putative phage cell wall peptidase
MSVTAQDIVSAAREWLDTPYHHQARLKGVGVDCAGLIIGIAHELKLSDFDISGYASRPQGDSLQRLCAAQMQPIALDAIRPGDVLLFRFEAHPCHLGILSAPERLIHAYLPRRKVVEHGLDPSWWRQLAAQFRLPGVA